MQVVSESTLRLTRVASQVTIHKHQAYSKSEWQKFLSSTLKSARITFRIALVVHTSLHRTSGLAVAWLDRETIKLSVQWFSWKLPPQRNVLPRIFVDVVRSRGSLFKFEWQTFQRMCHLVEMGEGGLVRRFDLFVHFNFFLQMDW